MQPCSTDMGNFVRNWKFVNIDTDNKVKKIKTALVGADALETASVGRIQVDHNQDRALCMTVWKHNSGARQAVKLAECTDARKAKQRFIYSMGRLHLAGSMDVCVYFSTPTAKKLYAMKCSDNTFGYMEIDPQTPGMEE